MSSKTTEMNRQHRFDVEMLEREQQFNAEQSQVAFDRQREFYDYQFGKESEYNSPAAQMQRYKAAGLNPFLANLDNGSTSVSATSPPAASASGSNTVNAAAFQSNTISALSNIANIAQGFASLDSQLSLNKSQSNLNDVNAAKAAGVDTDKVKSEIAVNSQSVATHKSQEKLNYSQSNKVDADFREVIYNLEHILPAKEKELLSNVARNYNDIEISQNTSKAQIAKMYQEIAESITRADLNTKNAALAQKELDAFEQRLENELNISSEQFQMMQNQNSRLKIESDVMQRLMQPRNGVESVEGISDFVKLMFMSVLSKLH
jgi:hypothetical protein